MNKSMAAPSPPLLITLVLLWLPFARPFAYPAPRPSCAVRASSPASAAAPPCLVSLFATSGGGPLPSRTLPVVAAAKPYRRAPTITKQGWQLTVSGLVCVVVLGRLAAVYSHLPSLFVWHVGAMAPMLPLGAASIGTVRRLGNHAHSLPQHVWFPHDPLVAPHMAPSRLLHGSLMTRTP